MSQEDISDDFCESHHCKDVKFENFGGSQLKMVSPSGLHGKANRYIDDTLVYKVKNTQEIS